MAKSSVSHGGFHTGSVGGDINFEVRGDFVTGNKVVGSTGQAVLTSEQKLDVQRQLRELRSAFAELKAELESSRGDSALALEAGTHLQSLDELQEELAVAEVEPANDTTLAKHVTERLQVAAGWLSKVLATAERGVDLAGKVGALISKCHPLIDAIRKLLNIT